MSTKKILKFYLIATLSLTSLSALSFNDDFRDYFSGYVSVFNYQGEQKVSGRIVEAKSSSTETDYVYRSNPARMRFEIQADGAKSLVQADKKDAEFLNLVFKVDYTPVQLQSIIFTIRGADKQSIKKAYLAHGKEIVATAEIDDGRLVFDKIDYSLSSDFKTVLTLKVDLSETLEVGDIISLEIDKPKDVTLEYEGNVYSLNGTYPMNAKYLSVAKSR